MRYSAPHWHLRQERALGKEAKAIVRLTDEERHPLPRLVAGPRVARDKARRARMRRKADGEGPSGNDGQSTDAVEGGMSTSPRVRQRFVEVGREAALARQPPARPPPRTRDGAQEARLVAIACSQAPEGRASWTLRLLADQRVELALGDALGRETVRPPLKHRPSSPGCRSHGSCRRRRTPRSSVRGKTPWRCSSDRMRGRGRWSAGMTGPSPGGRMSARRSQRKPDARSASPRRTNALARGTGS